MDGAIPTFEGSAIVIGVFDSHFSNKNDYPVIEYWISFVPKVTGGGHSFRSQTTNYMISHRRLITIKSQQLAQYKRGSAISR